MSLFDELGGLLGADNALGALGSIAGADNDTTKGLMGSAVPLLLGGLGKRAQSPGGASALFDLVKGNDGSVLDDIGGFLGGGDKDGIGDGLVGSILGSRRSAVESGLAKDSGLSLGSIAKFLPAIAPLVMGFLGRKQSQTGMDQAGLVKALDDETAGFKSGGLGGLLGMLDGGDDKADDAGFASGLSKLAGLGGLGAAAGAIGSKLTGAATDAVTTTTDTARAASTRATERVTGARPAYREPERNRFGWLRWLLPLLLIAALVALLFWWLGGDDDDDAGSGDGVELTDRGYRMGGILDTADGAGEFGTLLGYIDDAGLASALDGDGPFTVFAPSDAAFAELPAEVTSDPDVLADLLQYHVVEGEITAADLVDGAVTTLSGGEIVVDTAGPTVNGVSIITPDVEADNGVIHVIDQVLIGAVVGS